MSRKKILKSEVNLNKVGGRIAFIRIDKGLTQAQFANLINVSGGNLNGLEKHKYEPSYQTIIKILEYFKVNSFWLLTGEGDPYIYKDTIPDEDPFKDLLLMTREILGSGGDYAESLSANIKSFHRAFKMEKKLLNHEKRLATLEQKGEKQPASDGSEYKKAVNRE